MRTYLVSVRHRVSKGFIGCALNPHSQADSYWERAELSESQAKATCELMSDRLYGEGRVYGPIGDLLWESNAGSKCEKPLRAPIRKRAARFIPGGCHA